MILSHNELRDMLREIGEILGYKSITEYGVSKGRIDLVWKKDEEFIAFEIENVNGREGQLNNLIKVLDCEPTKFIPIFYKFPEINKELKGLSKVFPIKVERITVQKAKEERCQEAIECSFNSKISGEAKVKRFMKKTKASRATYYRYKKKVLLRKKLEEEDKKE